MAKCELCYKENNSYGRFKIGDISMVLCPICVSGYKKFIKDSVFSDDQDSFNQWYNQSVYYRDLTKRHEKDMKRNRKNEEEENNKKKKRLEEIIGNLSENDYKILDDHFKDKCYKDLTEDDKWLLSGGC